MTLRPLLIAKVLDAIIKDPVIKSLDTRVYVRLLFSSLQPGKKHANALSVSEEAFRRSAHRLTDAGWAYRYVAPGRTRRGIFVPWMTLHVEKEIVAGLAQVRNDTFPYGEWLMRCLLDLCVKDDDFHDDARPQWLITPDDGRRLELDRWYRGANVGLEFQGLQHFQKGDRYVTTGAQLGQRLRNDEIKSRLCSINGVKLIELTAEDLDHDRLNQKLTGVLPLVPVQEKGPLFRELKGMCQNYIKRIPRPTKGGTTASYES